MAVFDIAVITQDKIYISTGAGVYLGICAGDSWSWTQKNNGLRCKTCLHILAHPENDNILLTGNEWSIYKSVNGGNSWYEINEGIYAKRITTINAHPGNSQILFAGGKKGIYKTSDSGKHWNKIVKGFKILNLKVLEFESNTFDYVDKKADYNDVSIFSQQTHKDLK